MELDFNIRNIPIIFSSSNTPNIYDCIAFIRSKCLNPWEKIILRSSDIYLKDALASINIFYKDQSYTENDNVSNSLLTSEKIYMVITKDMFVTDEFDYGILGLINLFCKKYNVSELTVLLYFNIENDKDIKILKDIFVLLNDGKYHNYIIKYPNSLSHYLKDNVNTIDLFTHISDLNVKRTQDTCSYSNFDSINSFVIEEMSLNKKVITYSGIDGCVEQRFLIPYFVLKYNLKPMFYRSFISWCEEYHYLYFYGKMSLYERIAFVKNLPIAMRYFVKSDIQVDCRLLGFKFPKVLNIYNYETCEEVDVNIDLSKDRLIDYRTLFKNQTSFHPNGCTKSEDEAVNKMLVDKFIAMNKSKNINIRNSVIVLHDNCKYIVYTEGDFILNVLLQGVKTFPKINSDIPEKMFGKLHSHPLLKDKVGYIKPVYDLEVPLLLSLFPKDCLYLSYFEAALRWCKNLEDNKDNKGNIINLFDYLSLEHLRDEEKGRYFISSFGKPLNFTSFNKKDTILYLKQNIMKGRSFS